MLPCRVRCVVICAQWGQTSLHYAAGESNEPMVKLLVQLGANMNVTDKMVRPDGRRGAAAAAMPAHALLTACAALLQLWAAAAC